jgi:acyl-coenzyme A synthetase/AMP-(fatty) acid ligase
MRVAKVRVPPRTPWGFKSLGDTFTPPWTIEAGDGAVQAADGYFRILGRVDDVINVAGHRLGTKEL